MRGRGIGVKESSLPRTQEKGRTPRANSALNPAGVLTRHELVPLWPRKAELVLGSGMERRHGLAELAAVRTEQRTYQPLQVTEAEATGYAQRLASVHRRSPPFTGDGVRIGVICC